MVKNNKRGQVTQILVGTFSAISLLVLLFVLASITADVTNTVKDTQLIRASTTENLQLFNATKTVQFSNAQGVSGSDVLVNASSGVALTRGVNYTIDYAARTIVLNGTTAANNSFYNLTYSYTINSIAANMTDNGLLAEQKTSGFFPNIGMVIAASVMIAVLMAGFAFVFNR